MDIEIKPNKRNHKWLIFSVIMIFLMISFFYFYQNKSIKISDLRIEKVNLGTIDFEIITSGILSSRTRQIVSSESSGTVSEIVIDVGSVVKSDTVIIKLSNPILETEKLSAISNLNIANAELQTQKLTLQNQLLDQKSKLIELRSNLELSTQKLTAKEKLFASGIFSKLDISQSKLEVKQLSLKIEVEESRYAFFEESRVIQLKGGSAKIEGLESLVKLKLLQVDNLDVKAGLDGVIQSIDTEIGKSISFGQELALVSKPYPLIALLEVNQGAIRQVKIDTPVDINIANNKYGGNVFQIAPQVKNGMVEIKVEFPDSLPKSLKSQLSISATIDLSDSLKTLWLPYSSRVSTGINYFYKLNRTTNTLSPVSVNVGRITNSQIEILEGLKQGDEIILSDTSEWELKNINLK